MKGAIAALLLFTAPASADVFVSAFERVSTSPSPRVAAVVEQISAGRGLDVLVAQGLISTAYDCLPEHRAWCFDVLSGVEKSDFAVHEWGEWADGIEPDEMPNFVHQIMQDTAERGFNLFTNDELAR